MCRRFCAAVRQAMQLDRVSTLRLVVVIVDQNVGTERLMKQCDIAFWPFASFTAPQGHV